MVPNCAVSTVHHDVYCAIDHNKTLQGAAQGLHVLVTGASRGCGRATAVAFAIAGAAAVFLTGRDEAALKGTVDEVQAASSSCKAFSYRLDLTQPNLDEAVEKILQDGEGRIDVLVNNAGIMEDIKPVAESDPAHWWMTWETNLRGLYLMTRAVLPSMLKRGAGTIINTTSAGGLSTRAGASAYQGSKTAVISAMRCHPPTRLKWQHLLVKMHNPPVQKDVQFAMALTGVMPCTDMGLKMPKQYHNTMLIDTPQLSGGISVYLITGKADFLRGRYVGAGWDVTELEARKDEILEKNLLKLQLAV
ncbi:hypothetical protein MMC29_000179 [Sticta canariensis]|nr:hypothetical protein [Sticta canariensis]